MDIQLYTIVMGASVKPDRYAYKAIKMLVSNHHPIIAIANKAGSLDGIDFISKDLDQVIAKFDETKNIKADTITLYLNPRNQEIYYDFMLALKPRRIIFNPGTENPELIQLAEAQGIMCEEACTLVLLSMGQY